MLDVVCIGTVLSSAFYMAVVSLLPIVLSIRSRLQGKKVSKKGCLHMFAVK